MGVKLNYEVSGIINAVDQGTSNLCWLATTTTLRSWQRSVSFDMRSIADNLGAPFLKLFQQKKALPGSMIQNFLSASDIRTLAGQSRNIEGWHNLLKEKGLLAVGIDADAPKNYMAHLVTVYGIVGDGTNGGTQIKFIDPSGGKKMQMSFLDFSRRHGESDVTNLPFSTFYI